LELLTKLGVGGRRVAWYRVVATSPWFEVFLLIEPFFKKDSPWVKAKRGLRRMVCLLWKRWHDGE